MTSSTSSSESGRSAWMQALATLALTTLPVGLVLAAGFSLEPRSLKDPRAQPEPQKGRYSRAWYQDRRARQIRAFDEAEPEVVVISTSIAGHNIDAERLRERLGVSVRRVFHANVGPAYFYLALKNIVLRAEHRPRLVLILFRDARLVWTSYRADERSVRGLLDGDEPVFEKKAIAGRWSSVVFWMHRHFSAFERRAEAQAFLTEQLRRATATLLSDAPEAVDKASQRVFHASNLHPDLFPPEHPNERLTQWEGSFESLMDTSFVPDIIELARGAGIALAFVHVRSKHHALGTPEPPKKLRYLTDLEAYVEKSGAHYLDFSDAASIRAEHFGRYDHMKPAGVPFYTDALADALRAELPHFSLPPTKPIHPD